MRFDTAGWEFRGEPSPGHVRVWFTPQEDGVGLYFSQLSPDLPQNADSVDPLQEFYAAKIVQSGGQILEVGVLQLSIGPAVRVIFKTPQDPTGFTYVGSWTFPFRDFSFVIKSQCEERETTGFREAVLLDRRLAAGEIPVISKGKFSLPGWNPDAEEFGAEFPDHPLSRLRHVLKRLVLEETVEIDAGVRKLPGFALPVSRA